MKKSWRKKQEELEIEDDKKTKKIIDRNQEAWEHKSVLERGESKEEDEVWIDDQKESKNREGHKTLAEGPEDTTENKDRMVTLARNLNPA